MSHEHYFDRRNECVRARVRHAWIVYCMEEETVTARTIARRRMKRSTKRKSRKYAKAQVVISLVCLIFALLTDDLLAKFCPPYKAIVS